MVWSVILLFFFKQKTAYEMRISDWSSDVCSSDLARTISACQGDSTKGWPRHSPVVWVRHSAKKATALSAASVSKRYFSTDGGLAEETRFFILALPRSEERRGGKECVRM